MIKILTYIHHMDKSVCLRSWAFYLIDIDVLSNLVLAYYHYCHRPNSIYVYKLNVNLKAFQICNIYHKKRI